MQFCQQYCWIISNIASNIVDCSTILPAILLTTLPAILLIQKYCGLYCQQYCWLCSNIADNISDQQYCWQYCWQYKKLHRRDICMYHIHGHVNSLRDKEKKSLLLELSHFLKKIFFVFFFIHIQSLLPFQPFKAIYSHVQPCSAIFSHSSNFQPFQPFPATSSLVLFWSVLFCSSSSSS